MKKLLFPLIAALGCLTSHAQPSVQESPKFRVVCVGDSITQGSGAARGKSYPSQLQELLGKD